MLFFVNFNGAAMTLLVVNTPATFAGTSETIQPKSNFFFLKPACRPSAENPRGLAIFHLIIFII